jgi:hypothetical protein
MLLCAGSSPLFAVLSDMPALVIAREIERDPLDLAGLNIHTALPIDPLGGGDPFLRASSIVRILASSQPIPTPLPTPFLPTPIPPRVGSRPLGPAALGSAPLAHDRLEGREIDGFPRSRG